MTHELVWKTPPKPDRGAGSGRWGPVVDALMARPGEWALIDKAAWSSLAQNFLRSAAVGRIGRDRFEATCRSEGDGTYAAYARYVGDPGE